MEGHSPGPARPSASSARMSARCRRGAPLASPAVGRLSITGAVVWGESARRERASWVAEDFGGHGGRREAGMGALGVRGGRGGCSEAGKGEVTGCAVWRRRWSTSLTWHGHRLSGLAAAAEAVAKRMITGWRLSKRLLRSGTGRPWVVRCGCGGRGGRRGSGHRHGHGLCSDEAPGDRVGEGVVLGGAACGVRRQRARRLSRTGTWRSHGLAAVEEVVARQVVKVVAEREQATSGARRWWRRGGDRGRRRPGPWPRVGRRGEAGLVLDRERRKWCASERSGGSSAGGEAAAHPNQKLAERLESGTGSERSGGSSAGKRGGARTIGPSRC